MGLGRGGRCPCGRGVDRERLERRWMGQVGCCLPRGDCGKVFVLERWERSCMGTLDCGWQDWALRMLTENGLVVWHRSQRLNQACAVVFWESRGELGCRWQAGDLRI